MAVISKIYSHISLSQKNKIKLKAFNVATGLIKWGGKSQPKSLQNRGGNIGWCQGGKCHAEIREIDCFCWKDLVALDEVWLKFDWSLKGNFFMLFSKIWKIDFIVWNFWDLGFFSMIITSDLTSISHVLVSL